MRLEAVIQRDTRAAQPAANTVPVGTLYYVTDEIIIERSNGTSWQQYSGSGLPVKETLLRKVWVNFAAENQSPVVVGNSAYATGGALTNGSTATRIFTRFSTSSSGVQLGVVPSGALGSTYIYMNEKTRFFARIKTGPSINNIRIAVVLASGSFNAGADTSAAHYIGFRYSTSFPDAGLIGYCCNGTAINTQYTANTAAIAIDTEYELEVLFDGTTATFYVNNVEIGTLTVNLPTAAMSPAIRATNLAAEAKQILLGFLYAECI